MPSSHMNHRGDKNLRKRLHLPQVTLVAITSVAVTPTLIALQKCLNQIDFGEALFLSDQQPNLDQLPSVKWHKIVPLRSRKDYSYFLLTKIHEYISTSHMLCVQWDGYVLKAAEWQPEFLSYDYIGAPWPHFEDACKIGNGGFSLRSLRLMQACANLPYDTEEAEDLWICRRARPRLEADYGMRFAPITLASSFSYERARPTGQEFGFHGVFNMPDVIGARSLAKLLAELEPELIARNEHWDVLRWALQRGKIGLAWQVAKRLAKPC